ncbi:hypothetical protein MHYMCMPSP_00717 [Hyalomma marginatum]|uniref:Uncharacterized protein n=1 Tax=Hyalomma marginatum TaxID=34627 RepID=A0A8S4BUJ8_9ACAR|nr:hypothetical protein MHYMCMPASI_00466 [Hyalomma marginatum]CAG7592704.1 hypothetical protein MHYMCMPSP_00717 [Hyalomma marginatum]
MIIPMSFQAKSGVDNDKVIAHALQPFFSSGIADELNPRLDFTLCEEVSIYESAPITYHLFLIYYKG